MLRRKTGTQQPLAVQTGQIHMEFGAPALHVRFCVRPQSVPHGGGNVAVMGDKA